MKKSFAYLAAVLLFVLCLSGCGNSNMDNTVGVSPVPTAMPSASPYASPNVNDGVVKDRDGIIEDRDTGGAYDDNDILDGDRNGTSILDDGMTNNGNGNHVGGTVSPSPSASTKPSANPNK